MKNETLPKKILWFKYFYIDLFLKTSPKFGRYRIRLLVIWNQSNHHSFIHSTYPTREGKPLAWDFTVVDTVCPTAEKAKLRKIHRYRHLTDFHFIPIGVETLGPFLSNSLGNIHVLHNHKGGRGVRKWQFLITFSTESNHIPKPKILIT